MRGGGGVVNTIQQSAREDIGLGIVFTVSSRCDRVDSFSVDMMFWYECVIVCSLVHRWPATHYLDIGWIVEKML